MRNRKVLLTVALITALMGLLWVGTAVVFADGPDAGENEFEVPTETPTPEEWDKSSLYFDEGFSCQGDCDQVTAQVCNGDDSEGMAGSTSWELYWSGSGNPKNGTSIASDAVGPLEAGECQTLTYGLGEDPDDAVGNYKFKVYQRPGHPGKGELWSETCEVTCEVPPIETPEPPEEPEEPEDPEEPEPTPTPVPEEGHPVGQALATFFDVVYDEVMEWHEEGVGFGNIAKAYFLADELEGVTVEDVLAEKLAGTGWGQVMKALGLHPSSKGKNLGQVMSGHGDNEEPEGLTTTDDDHPGEGHGPPKKNKNKTPPGQAKEGKGKGKGK